MTNQATLPSRTPFCWTPFCRTPLFSGTRPVWILVVALTFAGTCWNPCDRAQASVPAIGASVGKAVAKYFAKEGSGEAAEYLGREGGKEIVQRVSAAAARQGGDATTQQVAKLVAQYGPESLAALDNAPAIMPVIRALRELPESQIPSALGKLAAGAPGRELAEATARFGSKAITSELKHPGVGLVLVRTLGDDGANLASKLSTDEAIAIARHADDLATLPPSGRQGVLNLITRDTDRFVSFVGRFVEQNPGKTLFTVATTTVILAEPERILGGDEIVYDADGNPVLISKKGLVGRTADVGGDIAQHVSTNYVRPAFIAMLSFVMAFAVMFGLLKLYHSHRKHVATMARTVEGTIEK